MRTTRKRKKRKFVLIFISAISLLLVFIGALGLLIYPYYNDLYLIGTSLDIQKLTQTVTINFYKKVSPKIELQQYEEDFLNAQSLEYLSQEQLAQYYNEGAIANRLEPKNTKLTINSINVDAYILDGETAHTMDNGPWHFPLSKYPGAKGNMVIIGHRFAELPPSQNTFFNLDKVSVGDKIEVSQDGNIYYSYTVIDTNVVEKTDRSVLADYGDYRITLITCTPLWTSKQRLVITGILDKAYTNI